jgi:hypothetical protein
VHAGTSLAGSASAAPRSASSASDETPVLVRALDETPVPVRRGGDEALVPAAPPAGRLVSRWRARKEPAPTARLMRSTWFGFGFGLGLRFGFGSTR